MLTRLRPGASALSFGLVAAVIAALLAHVVIDVVGDVALSHDAYDDIAHGSRPLAVLGLLAVSIAVAVRFIVYALDARARRETRDPLVSPSPVAFVGGVAVGATIVLLAMESFDSLAATGRLESFDDAFGGSSLLGVCVLLVAASLAGLLAHRVLRWLECSHDDLVRTIGAAFTADVRAPRMPAHQLVAPNAPLPHFATVLRRAAKRGPPPFPHP